MAGQVQYGPAGPRDIIVASDKVNPLRHHHICSVPLSDHMQLSTTGNVHKTCSLICASNQEPSNLYLSSSIHAATVRAGIVSMHADAW